FGMGLLAAGAALVTAHAQSPGPGRADGPMAGYPGVWIDDPGQGAVEILPCNGLLCGRVVWLKRPTDKVGQPIRDALNPDPRRRSQAVCGLTVIGNLKPQSNGTWDGGWIYDPKEGKTYDVELRLRSANQLSVTGYLGLKFLSETFIWTRAPGDLQRCAA
ncbi:MAG: DUF2147 domain-containing protein, partial [Hyphomicrobiaceae bacterium]